MQQAREEQLHWESGEWAGGESRSAVCVRGESERGERGRMKEKGRAGRGRRRRRRMALGDVVLP